ncbi:MAG: type III secretion inner membrane ring lipoprotein SctJ [Pseudomonadota bacterium]
MALIATTLSGCKVELYSELPEEEANEMVALLLANGIAAEKGSVDKGLVPLSVEEADLSVAVELLKENGYPRETFNDLGAIFQQQGLISSPLEERVRFIYGVSQSVSETLSHIDGVITARVHVVLPENEALAADRERPTASVFLRTRPGVTLEDQIQQIKLLVQASVEGLAYEDVVVAVFEAPQPPEVTIDGPPMESFLGVRYTADSADDVYVMAGGAAALFIAALTGNVVLLMRRRSRARPERPAITDRKNA